MPITSSSGLGVKKLALNVYQNLLDKTMKEKLKKQSLLHKIYDANSKRSEALDQALNEADHVNRTKKKMNNNPSCAASSSTTRSEEEFLEKFRNMSKSGPKHGIAEIRKNHLTNFLSDYILNGFESGLFVKPSLSDFQLSSASSQSKYEFEVSHVELMADLTALKIHWLISGSPEIDDETERFLQKCLKTQIRSTLTNERIISYVPNIVFVRDATRVMLEKLEENLTKLRHEETSAPEASNDKIA